MSGVKKALRACLRPERDELIKLRREVSSCAWSATFFLERRPGSREKPAWCRLGFRIHGANQADLSIGVEY